MKYVFILLLVCSSYLTYGQLTVSEMIKVYNMDLDQFETFAIMKGYEFDEIESKENVFGHSYAKGKGQNTKYLSLYTTYFGSKKVGYQTSNSTEFLKFKNEIKSKGFVLIDTEDFKGSIAKTYKLNKWKLRIFTINNSDGIAYEISLRQQ